MKPRLHPLYKKLLLLAVVIGPFVWLVLTEDGQWRTDTVLLSLLGKAKLNLAPERLHSALTEADFRDRFADLDLQCGAAETPFGDYLCTADIGTFNGIPSRGLALFFADEHLAAVRVDYRRVYHERILRWLNDRLGSPPQAAETAAGPTSTYTWPTGQGVIVAPAGRVTRDEEASLFWLSPGAIPGGAG